jgi:uncharacterized protein
VNTSIVGLTVALLIAPCRFSDAQLTNSTASSIIATTATGEVRVTPDRATIFVGVQSRAQTAAAAGVDNARRQRMILDTLRALGISGDRVSTMNYNVSPEMQYSPNGQTPPKISGYTVSNTVRADVQRLDEVGRVIDAALAKGANEISSLQFYSSKADSARRAALTAAVANARADAEALARAAGGALGSLIELSTADYPVRPVQEMALGRVAMAQAAKTPIEGGTANSDDDRFREMDVRSRQIVLRDRNRAG